ncbi:MAG: phosphatase PAP2 family protein [Thermodesulfobacteriota bacterium]
MEWLRGIDTALFFIINKKLSSPVLDVVMPFITDKSHLLVPAVILLILVIYRHKKAEIRLTVLMIITILSSDFAASTLKEVFMRVRPCHVLEGARVLTGCGGSYSFPSGHATNIFAALVLLSLRYKKYTPFFLFCASLVAYSRVYVGVHYPLDVIGGAIIGAIIATTWHFLDKKGLKAIKKVIKH